MRSRFDLPIGNVPWQGGASADGWRRNGRRAECALAGTTSGVVCFGSCVTSPPSCAPFAPRRSVSCPCGSPALGQRVQAWTVAAGLRLHPTKTRILDATQPGGFDFLGYPFERGYRWPRAKSLKKFKETIRAKTRRTQGQSLSAIVTDLNRTLRGWLGYFPNSHRTTFSHLDGWIRMRLRSILHRRQKRKGGGRGLDHQRWPNAFFAEQGLFSLVMAHASVRQSSSR